jgi:plastocyanin
MATLRALLLVLLATPLAACTVGDITNGGGGGGDDVAAGDDEAPGPDASPDPDYALTMTPPSAATTLGTTTNYSVTLTASHFEGPVTLAATGVPASWTATFEPPTVTLGLDDTAIVALSIQIPTDGEAATTPVTIGVDAQAAPGLRQVSSQLTVANELVVAIPDGTGGGAHAFPDRIDLRLGATLRILNSDTTQHRIHSDGGPGFPHQDESMAQGEAYVVTPGDVGGYNFYCHDHGVGTGVTNLVVQ